MEANYGPRTAILGLKLEKASFILARPILYPCDPNKIGGAWCPEWDARRYDDPLAWVCETVIVDVLPGAACHVLEIAGIAREDAMYAPDDRQSTRRSLIRGQANDRNVWPLPRRAQRCGA